MLNFHFIMVLERGRERGIQQSLCSQATLATPERTIQDKPGKLRANPGEARGYAMTMNFVKNGESSRADPVILISRMPT